MMLSARRLITVLALTVFWTVAAPATAIAGPLKVLFLGFDFNVDNARLDILGADVRFDHANSASWDGATLGAPTLAQLQAYDAVLAWANFVPPSQTGDVLADYVDGGGHVVLATFWGWASSGSSLGRINTTGYNPFTNGDPNAYSSSTLGAYNAADPLFNGVTTLSASQYRGDYLAGLDTGAVLAGSWADGKPLAGYNAAGNVVNITLFPSVFDFGHASGDYQQLFRNGLAMGDVAPVPEPGTFGLLALGGAALAYVRRRSRKS